MYVEIGSKFDLIINSIQDIDTCYGLIDSAIDMCETDDYLVFAIYKFNVMFFNYLDSINNVFLNEKYRNDELYGLVGISPSEKKSLLFSITLQLFELFKENDTISSSNYYLLLCYFVGKKNIIVGVDPIVSENNKDADNSNSVFVDDEVNINQSDISNENNYNVYSDDSLDNLTDDNNIEESVNGLENQQVVTFDENSQEEINNSVSPVEDIISVEDDSIIEDKDFNSVVQSYISNENNQDVNNGVSLDKSVTVDDEDIAHKRFSKFLKYVILYLLFFIVALVLIIILLNSYDDVSKLWLDYNNLLEGVSVDEKMSYIESLEREISEKTASFGNYDEEIKTISDKISSISSDNEALSNELSFKQSELSKKKNTYDELNNKFVKMTLKMIPNVITFNQYPNYPNGCEAVALYILLKYYNVNVSVDRVMDSLPIGKTPYLVDGVLHGGDPNYEFLGDPRSDDGNI